MSTLIKLAREQRKSKNPWEAKLWQYLRNHRMCDEQFRRQVPFGEKYIVDFCCKNKRLAIELDGSQHSGKSISEQDKLKEDYLVANKYKVLRFWNNELDNNLEGALETIRLAIISPHPNPPPQAGEGRLQDAL